MCARFVSVSVSVCVRARARVMFVCVCVLAYSFFGGVCFPILLYADDCNCAQFRYDCNDGIH